LKESFSSIAETDLDTEEHHREEVISKDGIGIIAIAGKSPHSWHTLWHPLIGTIMPEVAV
jgi:hypothetical protein